MQKKCKILVSIQIGILMTAVALPVQAAINIGAPRPSTGSVVTIKSNVAAPSIWIGQPNLMGNSVSLKNVPTLHSTIPVTTTPTPVKAPAPAPALSTAPTAPVIPPVTVLTADEQLMVDMLNQQRQAVGVNPVKADLRLTAVGRAKANDMKVNNYFNHTSPTYGSAWAMMQQAGITVRWAGENISGNKSVARSMAALMLSPGHKANILDPRFTHVGVGIAYGSAYGNLYVQEFLQQ